MKKHFAIKIFLVAAFCLLVPLGVLAYKPLVAIPGLGEDVDIPRYLKGIYDFLLSIVGITAVFMMVLGGMRYIAAAGNSSAIADAKNMIEGAITGLLLALFSWVVIDTLNPDLLNITPPATSVLGGAMNSGPQEFCGYKVIKKGDIPLISADEIKCVCQDGQRLDYQANTTCNDVCKDNCVIESSKIECVADFKKYESMLSQGYCRCSNIQDISLDSIEMIRYCPAAECTQSNCEQYCRDDGFCVPGRGKTLVTKLKYDSPSSISSIINFSQLYATTKKYIDNSYSISQAQMQDEAKCYIALIRDIAWGFDEYALISVANDTIVGQNDHVSLKDGVSSYAIVDSKNVKDSKNNEAEKQFVDAFLAIPFKPYKFDGDLNQAVNAAKSPMGITPQYRLSSPLKCHKGEWFPS